MNMLFHASFTDITYTTSHTSVQQAGSSSYSETFSFYMDSTSEADTSAAMPHPLLANMPTHDVQQELRELLDRIIDIQLSILRGDKESGEELSIADFLGMGEQKAAIEGHIDRITIWQVDLYIQQNGLKVDDATHRHAIDAVRRAVSGETVAAQFGLPQGSILSDAHMPVAEEVALRMSHIEKMLSQVFDSVDQELVDA